MTLRSQRRMAAEILKVGQSRIWIDSDEAEKVSSAITRNEIRRLIHEGVIRRLTQTGVSRGRIRLAMQKKKAGKRKGPGSRKGSWVSIRPTWVDRIRGIRRQLKLLRDRRLITRSVYRKLLLMAKGGTFRDLTHLREYVEAHNLARRR